MVVLIFISLIANDVNIHHVFIFHLYSLFGEMSVRVFWIIDLRAFLSMM